MAQAISSSVQNGVSPLLFKSQNQKNDEHSFFGDRKKTIASQLYLPSKDGSFPSFLYQKNIERYVLSELKRHKFPENYSVLLIKDYLDIWMTLFSECSLNQLVEIIKKAKRYYGEKNPSSEELMSIILNEAYPSGR